MFALKSPVIDAIVALHGELAHQKLFELRRELWRKSLLELKTQLAALTPKAA